jgi:hypothetical protein
MLSIEMINYMVNFSRKVLVVILSRSSVIEFDTIPGPVGNSMKSGDYRCPISGSL